MTRSRCLTGRNTFVGSLTQVEISGFTLLTGATGTSDQTCSPRSIGTFSSPQV